MNKVNKHAHTRTRIQENENLKKGNGGSRPIFRSSTLLRQCSITRALYSSFRTVMTKRITRPQDARGTYILLN